MCTVSFQHVHADSRREDMTKIMRQFLMPYVESGLLLNNNPYL